MSQSMKDRLDIPEYQFGWESAWELPPLGGGITEHWRDAFIATQLQDVFARRYFGKPFPKLQVEQRTIIRGRVEFFIAAMTRIMEGDEC